MTISDVVQSLATLLGAGVLFATLMTLRHVSDQARAAGNSAVLNIQSVGLAYFDYRFGDLKGEPRPICSPSGHPDVVTIKDFREAWFDLADGDDDSRAQFRTHLRRDDTSDVRRAAYEISVAMNRLGVACMLSRDILAYVLALHAKIVLKDFVVLEAHLVDANEGPIDGEDGGPPWHDRRAALWLVFVCTCYVKQSEHVTDLGVSPSSWSTMTSSAMRRRVDRVWEVDRPIAHPSVVLEYDRLRREAGFGAAPGARRIRQSLKRRASRATSLVGRPWRGRRG